MIVIRFGFRKQLVLVCLGSTNVTCNLKLNSTDWPIDLGWIESYSVNENLASISL